MAGLGRSRPLTTRGAAEVRVMRRMRRAGGDSPLARAEGDSDPVRRRTIALAMLGPHQSQPAMSQAPRPATAGGTLALCLGRRCQARPPCMDSMGQFCRPCRGLMGSGLRLGTVILHLHILTSATSATGCQCLLGQPRPCLIRRGRHLILRWVQRRRLLRRLEALMRAARAAEDEKKVRSRDRARRRRGDSGRGQANVDAIPEGRRRRRRVTTSASKSKTPSTAAQAGLGPAVEGLAARFRALEEGLGDCESDSASRSRSRSRLRGGRSEEPSSPGLSRARHPPSPSPARSQRSFFSGESDPALPF